MFEVLLCIAKNKPIKLGQFATYEKASDFIARVFDVVPRKLTEEWGVFRLKNGGVIRIVKINT